VATCACATCVEANTGAGRLIFKALKFGISIVWVSTEDKAEKLR